MYNNSSSAAVFVINVSCFHQSDCSQHFLTCRRKALPTRFIIFPSYTISKTLRGFLPFSKDALILHHMPGFEADRSLPPTRTPHRYTEAPYMSASWEETIFILLGLYSTDMFHRALERLFNHLQQCVSSKSFTIIHTTIKQTQTCTRVFFLAIIRLDLELGKKYWYKMVLK